MSFINSPVLESRLFIHGFSCNTMLYKYYITMSWEYFSLQTYDVNIVISFLTVHFIHLLQAQVSLVKLVITFVFNIEQFYFEIQSNLQCGLQRHFSFSLRRKVM